jgi:phosphoglycerate kinase
MTLKTVADVSAEALLGKRVLVRVDWNVPRENGKITNDFRIQSSLATLRLLQEAGAQVTVVTHLGDDGSADIAPVRERALALLPGIEVLENVRRSEGELANDAEFAQSLAKNFDLFVNDAFAVCHREHASVVGVPQYVPSYAGLLVAKEIAELSRAFNPDRPFIFILGGAKFGTKAPLIKKFLGLADKIFIGGALANTCFKALGYEIGQSVADENVELVKPLVTDPRIMLPATVITVIEGKTLVRTAATVSPDAKIVDVAPETLEEITDYIKSAKLVLWNGPLGNFEAGFMTGTEAMARIIAETSAYSIIGGGDTIAAVERLGALDKFNFVSTGGGAMLDFLAEGTLPGLEALKQSQEKFGI